MRALNDAALVLTAEHIEIDLAALTKRIAERTTPDANRTQTAFPDVSLPPPDKDAFAVDLGHIALREILEHADAGSAVVRIPVPAQAVRAGPLSIDIPPDTAVVLEIIVLRGGQIDRTATHGRLEPALALPLGIVLNGIYLNDSGELITDVDGFPDINLSRLVLRGLRVPDSLAAVLALIFPTPSVGATEAAGEEVTPAGHDNESGARRFLDFTSIEVTAQGIRLRDVEFSLGSAVSLRPGSDTELTVVWQNRNLRIDGTADIVSATFHNAALSLEAIQGRARVMCTIDFDGGAFHLSLTSIDASLQHGRVHVGVTQARLAPLRVLGGSVQLTRSAGRAPQFTLDLPHVEGVIEDGSMGLLMSKQLVQVDIARSRIEGQLMVSDRSHRLDVQVHESAVRVHPFEVDVGVASASVAGASCRGTGRIRAATDLGVVFVGALTGDARIDSGVLALGRVHARAREGSASLVLRELAFSPAGIEALALAGRAVLVLDGGAVPLLGSHLQFSPGARTEVVLEELTVDPSRPTAVRLALEVDASAEQCVVDPEVLVLPQTHARLVIPRVALNGTLLSLDGLRAELATRAEEPDAIR